MASEDTYNTAAESYPCYIRVSEDENHDCIELPSETNGSILLSTLQGQFPNAIGLKYKSSGGSWRGVRLSDNALDPPLEGWGSTIFHITLPKTDSVKRKMEQSPNREPEAKLVKTGIDREDLLSDLIVLGLPYKATEDDLKEYFEQFGELALHEIKLDPRTKESRGFGFIRFKGETAAEKALKSNHSILGRRCEVRLPKRKDDLPMKLFIGRLPEGTTKDDLLKVFEDYGEITDSYIPNPFRGFGFVTFASTEVGRYVLNKSHSHKGSRLNVTYAEPKVDPKGAQGWGGRDNRRFNRNQDPPFNFDDMRRMVSRSNHNQQQFYNSSDKRGGNSQNMNYAGNSRGNSYDSQQQNYNSSNMGGDTRNSNSGNGTNSTNSNGYGVSSAYNPGYNSGADAQVIQYPSWTDGK